MNYNKFKIIEIKENGWKRIEIIPGASAFLIYDNKVGIINEKRYLKNKWGNSLNIPRGGMDDGEKIIECAIREAEEEMQIKLLNHEILDIFEVYPDNGVISSAHPIVFIKTEKIQQENKKDEDDISAAMWLTKEEITKKIKNKEIVDAFTIGAFYYALINEFIA